MSPRRSVPSPFSTYGPARSRRKSAARRTTASICAVHMSWPAVTLLAVAVAGLLAQPVVSSVIAGATKPEQVRANAAAADWELDEEDWRALRAVLTGEQHGPHRDALLLGAALALEIVGRVDRPRDGVRLAKEAIDSGAARRTLDKLAAFGAGAGL